MTVDADHVGLFIPARRRGPHRPFLAADAAQHTLVRDMIDDMAAESEPGTASGIWLDMVASNYGEDRTLNETDARLRKRIMSFGTGVTLDSLEELVNDILSAEGLGSCTIVEWYESNHFIEISDINLGFFLDYSRVPLPNGFVVDLPSTTSDEVIASIMATLNRKKGSGTRYQILAEADPTPGPTMDSTIITMDSTTITMDASS